MNSSMTLKRVFSNACPKHIKDVIKSKKPTFYVNGVLASLSDTLDSYVMEGIAMIEIHLNDQAVWFTHIEVES